MTEKPVTEDKTTISTPSATSQNVEMKVGILDSQEDKNSRQEFKAIWLLQ